MTAKERMLIVGLIIKYVGIKYGVVKTSECGEDRCSE
jgi:hypothetical protein